MSYDDNHPEAEEIGRMLDAAEEKLNQGYEVTFEISQYDAELLVGYWEKASQGDTDAVYLLMAEMGKLVAVLQDEFNL